MDKKGFAPILIVLIVVVVLIAGGIWYYKANQPSSSTPDVSNSVAGVTISSHCDQDYSTSSLVASWTPIVGAWKSTDQNSSFGDEVDFTSHSCDGRYGFRSYYYNPNTGVTQPSIWGTWNFTKNGLSVIDETNTSSPYIFSKFTVSTTTLLLFGSRGSTEKYSRIPAR